jgi:hypothetical protein
MVVLIDFGGAVAQIFHMEGSSLKGKSRTVSSATGIFPAGARHVIRVPGPGRTFPIELAFQSN